MPSPERLASGTEPRPTGYAVLLVTTIVLAALAAMTLVPLPASKPNLLGYFSSCPFAPWSTLILLALAGGCCLVRSRLYGRNARRAAVPESAAAGA